MKRQLAKVYNNNELSETGSIIVVVATDAPLLPHQLKRLTQRVSLGIGKNGGIGGNGSGDIFIAFSTANKVCIQQNQRNQCHHVFQRSYKWFIYCNHRGNRRGYY